MSVTGNVALNRAKDLVQADFGKLTDLPAELQNTIANIYYKFSEFLLCIEEDKQWQASANKSNNLATGVRKHIIDSTFLIESKKSLPGIIADFRNEALATKDPKEIKFTTFVLLSIFKYRIDNVMKKSTLRVKLEISLKKSSVDEIQDLYKKFD